MLDALRIPAVSDKFTKYPSISICEDTTSRVVPAMFDTMARLEPTNLLNIDDLPTYVTDYFDKGENHNISNDAIVKVIEYEAQGILEIKNCSNMKFNQESNKFENALADYRRISDTEYLNKKRE